MPPKKNPQADCHRRIKITLELKREIIDNRERGMSVAALARRYNRTSSTICTILKNKDRIKETDASKGVTRISMHRLQVLDDVEKLLLSWINEKQLKGDVINENIVCQKAKKIYTDLLDKTPSASPPEKVFKASRGWLEKFKRRTGIPSFVRHGDKASRGPKTLKSFLSDIKKRLEGCLPQQVFSCHETSLLWKKMPKRTYLAAKENALPGHKPMEDRLTLLLCANASGDLKIKPLLVYHSETPRAFKKCNVRKNRLSVLWRSNSKAMITRDFLIEWVNKVFGPSVKKYLLEMNLPLKTLLVMSNAPGHPPGIQNDLLEEFKFIEVQFLPPKMSALLQPMEQQVITSFKKLYTKALFERCLEVVEGTNLTLEIFWNYHFHIFTGLKLIEKAWGGVTKRTLNCGWKKLWPEIVEEGIEADPMESTVNEILSLAKTLRLEVDAQDIDELVEEHKPELATEDLEGNRVSRKEAAEEGEGEARAEQQSSGSIREMLGAWETVASFIEKHHPDKAVASYAINLFSDNAVSPFQEILKRRQKEIE